MASVRGSHALPVELLGRLESFSVLIFHGIDTLVPAVLSRALLSLTVSAHTLHCNAYIAPSVFLSLASSALVNIHWHVIALSYLSFNKNLTFCQCCVNFISFLKMVSNIRIFI